MGKKIYNNELSFKRADEIKKFLISNGIKNTIEIQGLGDANPIAPNNNDENRRKNRRVEIYLKAIDATN